MPQDSQRVQEIPAAAQSKTGTAGALPTAVSGAFAEFLKNTFGGTAAPGNPSQGQPGAQTPAVVGGLPPQLTPSSPLSLPSPVPLTPQARPGPVRGIAPAGTQYQSGAARNEAVTASLSEALVSAITSNKDKKDADNIAKAQNTMNIFMHAVQQGDMATANLYATDPKITGSWEKYLKQDYKRVPGVPTKQEERPKADMLSGSFPTRDTPAAPGTGEINQPGGIAIPRDMTPMGQMSAQALAAAQRIQAQQSDAQRAEPILGAGGFASPEQARQHAMQTMGLALNAEQQATIEGTLKAHAITTWKEVVNFATGQEAMNARAAGNNQASRDVANINAKARLAAAQKYVDANKDIAKLKGSALQIGTYTQLISGLNNMAAVVEKEIAGMSDTTWGGLGGASDAYKAKIAQRDGYLASAKQIQSDLEGYKLMLTLAPGLMDPEATKPDTAVETPTAPEGQ